jgi:hypothetical protein
LNRSREWTFKLRERIPYVSDPNKRFSGSQQVIIKGISQSPSGEGACDSGEKTTNNEILDLLLVEALLQYGDKTEITIARLAREIKVTEEIQNIPLKQFKNDVNYDNQKGFICTDMAQRIISSFARFRACRFIPLILVDVREVKENGIIKEKMDVIMHYVRFDSDDDIFRILRYHNEKDFFDLGFLEVIQIHIPMLVDNWPNRPTKNPFLEIEFKKVEDPFDKLPKKLEKQLSKILEKLGGKDFFKDAIEYDKSHRHINPKDRFPYTPQNRKAIREHSWSILNPEEKKKAEGIKKAFCKTCDLIVPASFEIMAVLNLFREEE